MSFKDTHDVWSKDEEPQRYEDEKVDGINFTGWAIGLLIIMPWIIGVGFLVSWMFDL